MFRGEPRHLRLIALPGVPLLQDDAGVPLHLAGYNIHQRTYELRLLSDFDFREVHLAPRLAEPPTHDVERACRHIFEKSAHF